MRTLSETKFRAAQAPGVVRGSLFSKITEYHSGLLLVLVGGPKCRGLRSTQAGQLSPCVPSIKHEKRVYNLHSNP